MDIWRRLSETSKPIVLYGMGNGADKILNIMESKGLKADGVFASDGFVRKKAFRGMPIMSYEEAKSAFGDMVVLVAFGSSLPEVLENVKRIENEQELYVPDVPVVGDNLFDIDFVRAHRKELERVYCALATDKDRDIFESLVRYKLSGDPSLLYETATDEDELYNVVSPDDNSVFMDCGAFTGDTVAAYLRHVNSYEKIYAIEPDARSFKRLSVYMQDMERVFLINAPLSNGEEMARFSQMGSRGSHLSGEGKEVLTRSIDGILNGERADIIKIDVEGEEALVLEGAAGTIKRYAPKLIVSCYHRAEDIFALPLQVLSLNDYIIHIRHPMYLPPWDALFIFK